MNFRLQGVTGFCITVTGFFFCVNVIRLPKQMAMSPNQNAEQNSNLKTSDKSYERVEHLKHFGTTLKNQNSINEELKSRLKLENACYDSVQNLLSSRLLSKNVNIKIY